MKTQEQLPTSHGQGKRVTTLLTEDGCHFPVISHDAYIERRNVQSAPFSSVENRGLRRHSLHNTTFTLGEKQYSDFITTSKLNFGGSRSLNPVRRPPQCHSMHKSQLEVILANRNSVNGSGDWTTDYSSTYYNKDIIPANRLHLSSFKNKINQTEGSNINMVVQPNRTVSSYWSQYGRIHSKLGHILGPGVPQGYPIRQQYNTLTGENKGSAWKDQNARMSGNRILQACRKSVQSTPIIS